MHNEAKLQALLGLAQKAGKLATGAMAVEKSIKTGKAKLLIIAPDASASTVKEYRHLASNYRIPISESLSKFQLGSSIGKSERAAIAVIDEGFAKSLSALLNE